VNILIVVVIVGLMYVIFMVPARRRRQSHAAMQDSVAVGNEVITAGGLHGHVREIDEENRLVRLEIAPDVVVTLDRRAVAAVAREIEVEVEPDAEPEPEIPAEAAQEPR
jgi:preprotein translocase subunit YajC